MPLTFMNSAPSTPHIRLKSIALPVEHGGWAFLIEPLLLGMLLGPSLAGLFLCIAAFGIFLLYQPLQIWFKDFQRQKRYPRTVWAERFVLIYSAVAAIGGLGILWVDSALLPFVILTLLAAAPFACVQMLMVVRGYARYAVTEICGAIALGATVTAIVLMYGWPLPLAFALWVIPALRATASIIYVRTRLRLGRGREAAGSTNTVTNRAFPVAVQGVAVIVTAAMVAMRLLPVGSIVAMLILLIRAAYGLYVARGDTPARVIGFQEIAFGLATILLVILVGPLV